MAGASEVLNSYGRLDGALAERPWPDAGAWAPPRWVGEWTTQSGGDSVDDPYPDRS